ncbi:hypothetical protein Pdw03_1430 [Penicillium digitatum]|uniref:Uncharacterized protein n=2 Tax=Penicillium digitatum TaxID=36651 RepID=K9G2W4_PEND1|nr:hypothetical protein PDIP_40870 [Penicillium digitatum Pd1]EKV15222.1 hypothetical protein PDIP_40870 [Penicillium digitatum Pd1]QQK46532.1 hypothetical protein Pdw03_1430 [Penicillium digitatum]
MEGEYSPGYSRPHSAAPVSSTTTSSFHIAASNSAAYLPTHGDGNETVRDSPGLSAKEIATPTMQSRSFGMIDEHTVAWMGSTLNMHENADPIPQEPTDVIDERAIAWMGSTLNMHENADPIPQEPMDAIDERTIAWMGSTLNMHEKADLIPQESMDMLQNRGIFGPDGAVEPFAVEHRDPQSQTSIETPNISSQYQWPIVVK